MLVFIDESGDSGLKIHEGSSRYFSIALVIFEENEEATACDQRIELLKRELGWREGSEFHFKKNSDRVRKAFLHAIVPYNFFYTELSSIKIRRNYTARDSKIRRHSINMQAD